MKPKTLLCLALALICGLFVSTATGAAEPEKFSADLIQKIWPELWKPGKEPAIDPLSEPQVVQEMAGKWVMLSGALGTDKMLISLETNRQVTVSGIKDGKAWEAGGQWKVISNKLVLFVKPGNELPSFIFRLKGKPYMFYPWADTLMSEMKRENQPATPLKPAAPDQQFQLQPVLPVNRGISEANILATLDSIDRGLLNKDAAAVVANFASNAVITATVVERQRTDTTTNDPSSYRRSLEAGFKSFDDYKLWRKAITVEMSPGGRKATSQSTLIESYSFSGNTQRAVTQESGTFELINGKARLTKRNSKVTIE